MRTPGLRMSSCRAQTESCRSEKGLMPGLTKACLAKLLTEGLKQGGAEVTGSSFAGSRGGLPWLAPLVFRSGRSRKFRVYVWTVGHGGKTRAKNEYRIQTKLPKGHRLQFEDGTTLLLGYYNQESDSAGRAVGNEPTAGLEVVVAWDPVQHLRLGASSSCHVGLDLMSDAYLSGLSSRSRRLSDDRSEAVLVMRTEYLASYFEEAAGGHDLVKPERLISRYLRGSRA